MVFVFDVQVLNLFLALLLSSFGAESLKNVEEDEGPNKLQEAIDRINRFVIYVKSHVIYCIKTRGQRKALALQECDSGFAAKPGVSALDGGIQFGNGHIHERETSPEGLNDSPQHHNGQYCIHVISFISAAFFDLKNQFYAFLSFW